MTAKKAQLDRRANVNCCPCAGWTRASCSCRRARTAPGAPDGRLFLSNDSGIFVADVTTDRSRELVHGVRWFDPSVSRDGRYVVFGQRDPADGQPIALAPPPRLRLLDTRAGTLVAEYRRDGGVQPRFVAGSAQAGTGARAGAAASAILRVLP